MKTSRYYNRIVMEVVSPPASIKSTSRLSCSARGCNSQSNENLDIFFHSFPKSGKIVVQVKIYLEILINKFESVETFLLVVRN